MLLRIALDVYVHSFFLLHFSFLPLNHFNDTATAAIQFSTGLELSFTFICCATLYNIC